MSPDEKTAGGLSQPQIGTREKSLRQTGASRAGGISTSLEKQAQTGGTQHNDAVYGGYSVRQRRLRVAREDKPRSLPPRTTEYGAPKYPK
jgi:hypothetical protein